VHRAPFEKLQAFSQPACKGSLGQLGFSERDVLGKKIRVRCLDHCTVQRDEGFTADRGGPLVAVDEWMVASDTICECGCQIGKIRRRIAIGMNPLKPLKRPNGAAPVVCLLHFRRTRSEVRLERRHGDPDG
jgi:hypothetical protein